MEQQQSEVPVPSLDRLRIGGYIRSARRHADMTQRELAIAVGGSQRTISAWECGHSVPGILEWLQIADATRNGEMLDLRVLGTNLSVTHQQQELRLFDLEPRSGHLQAVG